MPRKYCPACERKREVSTFGDNVCNPDGKSTYCRECNAAKQREWKAAHPEKVREWKQAYLQRVRERNLRRRSNQSAYPAAVAAGGTPGT
jgi:hypothetical protein